MLNTIVRLSEALLLRLLPAHGRHRPADAPPAVPQVDAPTLVLPRVRRMRPDLMPLRGEDSPLVRPYVLTTQERQERWLQRGRRRALWFAVHGIDAGPRWIHGVEVTG
ncbi:hypothetical protein ACWC2K_33825 [Streptomyces chattanoogensis]